MRLVFSACAMVALAISSFCSFAQSHATRETLDHKLKSVVDTSKAHIGFAVLGIDFADSFYINRADHFPMQSTYKFPLAVYVLHLVDEGKFSLDQVIHLPRKSLDQKTWSPMVDKWLDQDIDISLRDLITYTVSQSDNNGCDALFRLVGGPAIVNDYMHSIGITGINIVATEHQMHQKWSVQYTNWCEPNAMAHLLRDFYNGKMLSPATHDFLVDKMTNSVNNNRTKGQLPSSAVVAHKTGTSGTNKKGITAATNDVGIITLSNGKHIAVVAFISDYLGSVPRGEGIIAQLTKLVWDHYATGL